MRVHDGVGRCPSSARQRLRAQLLDRLGAGAGHRLVGRDRHVLEARRRRGAARARTPAGWWSSWGSRRCRGGPPPCRRSPRARRAARPGPCGTRSTCRPRRSRAATASGANACDVAPPAEKSARSKPSSASAVSSCTSSSAPANAHAVCRPSGPRRTGRPPRPGSPRSCEDREHDRPDDAGRADDGDRGGYGQSAASSPVGLGQLGLEGRRAAPHTASATWSRRSTHETLIGEVAIMRTLMPEFGQRLEHLGGDAGVALHAGADQADLAGGVVDSEVAGRARGTAPRSCWSSAARSSAGSRT